MRISDWSSDVCSSDLEGPLPKPAMALLSAIGGAAQRRGFHRRFLTGAGRPAYRLGLLQLACQVADAPDDLLHRRRRDAIRLAGAVAVGCWDVGCRIAGLQIGRAHV